MMGLSRFESHFLSTAYICDVHVQRVAEMVTVNVTVVVAVAVAVDVHSLV